MESEWHYIKTIRVSGSSLSVGLALALFCGVGNGVGGNRLGRITPREIFARFFACRGWYNNKGGALDGAEAVADANGIEVGLVEGCYVETLVGDSDSGSCLFVVLDDNSTNPIGASEGTNDGDDVSTVSFSSSSGLSREGPSTCSPIVF